MEVPAVPLTFTPAGPLTGFSTCVHFFLVTSPRWFLGRVLRNNSKWRLLNLVPLSAMLLDLLENSTTTAVMAAFPQRVGIAEIGASFFTPLKWLAVEFSAGLIGVQMLVISKYLQKSKERRVNKKGCHNDSPFFVCFGVYLFRMVDKTVSLSSFLVQKNQS